MTQRPENIHAHYHAHVYFGPATVAQARALSPVALAQGLPVEHARQQPGQLRARVAAGALQEA